MLIPPNVQWDRMQCEESKRTAPTKLVDKIYVVDFNAELGGGSFSHVYHATMKTNSAVQLACKVISKAAIEEQVMKGSGSIEEKQMRRQYIINRIRSEVKIAQRVRHENIVEFRHFTETGNNIYIFMELCDGTLEQLIKKHGPMVESKALPLIRDLLEGACVLYDNNITHRDIKAANILMKGGRLKLADFGFAKELAVKDVCKGGTGVGTLFYMAPELVLQEKPQYSIKCDVWSIGILIYYILHGYLPWHSQITLQAYVLVIRQPLAFAAGLNISPRLKNLVSAMLMFRDEDRINVKAAKRQLQEIMGY